MKLILAIVHNDDAPLVSSELNKADFHSTKIASTGGFLSSGNTTVITGVDVTTGNECHLYITRVHGIAVLCPPRTVNGYILDDEVLNTGRN